ncbi:hypothetical protein GC175_25420 [bacterium]|nr:hypothetical protein [bacterium]
MCSHPSLFMVVLLASFVFSGCYNNERDALLIGTPLSQGQNIITPDDDAISEADTNPMTLLGIVNTNVIRARQGPSINTPIVASLRAGSRITITGRSTDSAWLQIEIPDVGGSGWLLSESVIPSGDISLLDLAESNSEDLIEAETVLPEITPTLVASGTPIRLNLTDLLAAVNTEGLQPLRVRKSPSTNAEIVWRVRNGEYYPVISQTEDGVWVSLAIPELAGTGWVSSRFVTITEVMTLIPLLGSVTVTTGDGTRLRVRNAPLTDAKLTGYLEEGETHEVVAVTADRAWALINIPDVAGPSWIATEFVMIGEPVR